MHWTPLFEGLTVAVGYLLAVRVLRWRRLEALERSYRGTQRPMTPVEAQKIIQVSSGYDMPGLMGFALSFALFKTYGIVRGGYVLVHRLRLLNQTLQAVHLALTTQYKTDVCCRLWE